MEEVSSILRNDTQVVFFLILAAVVWVLFIAYMFCQSRRKKHGRRFDDRKVAR